MKNIKKLDAAKLSGRQLDSQGCSEGQGHAGPRPVSQGHKPWAENAKVNFRLNATVNPFFQF